MNPYMNEREKRRILSEVALGNISPDTVIANGTLFNVFTREFIRRQSIWIKDGRIAYVGPDHDPPKDTYYRRRRYGSSSWPD
jgi:adenine deaminase